MRSTERSDRLSAATFSSFLGTEFPSANQLLFTAMRMYRLMVWSLSKDLKISGTFSNSPEFKCQLSFL